MGRQRAVGGVTSARRLSVFLLFLFAAAATCSRAVFGENTDPPVTAEVEEVVLPETAREPEPDSVALRFVTLRSGATYVVPDDPITDEQRAILGRMNPQERERFQERRIGFLRRAAGLLHGSRLALGAGAYLHEKMIRLNPIRKDKPEPFEGTFRQRMRWAVQQCLLAANQQLFDHADVIARSNEFGLTLGISAYAGAGLGRRNLYGGMGLGISLGYNYRDQAATIEIFADQDNLVKTFPATANLRVMGKIMGRALVETPANSGQGSIRRMMLFPGHVGLVDNSQVVEAGIAPGLTLGLPSAYYEMENTHMPLLRVGISPLQTGVRVRGMIPTLAYDVLHPVGVVAANLLRTAGRVTGNLALVCWGGWKGLFRRGFGG